MNKAGECCSLLARVVSFLAITEMQYVFAVRLARNLAKLHLKLKYNISEFLGNLLIPYNLLNLIVSIYCDIFVNVVLKIK